MGVLIRSNLKSSWLVAAEYSSSESFMLYHGSFSNCNQELLLNVPSFLCIELVKYNEISESGP